MVVIAKHGVIVHGTHIADHVAGLENFGVSRPHDGRFAVGWEQAKEVDCHCFVCVEVAIVRGDDRIALAV